MASVRLSFNDRGRSVVLERAICDGWITAVVYVHCSFSEKATSVCVCVCVWGGGGGGGGGGVIILLYSMQI